MQSDAEQRTEEWQRRSGSALDYFDVIMIAQLLSMAGTPELDAYPPLASVPAFQEARGSGNHPEGNPRRVAGSTRIGSRVGECADRLTKSVLNIEIINALLRRLVYANP